MTYGPIQAGQHGWGNGVALGALVAGLVVLGGFLAWERRLSSRPDGQPLVDMALFRSRAYTWGVILVAVAILAMMGVLFTMPQYFQGVVGTNAMGSGVRLLSLVGGLILGAIPADRVARALGAKVTVGVGFVALGAGLALGSGTNVGSSEGSVAAWMALVGFGMGLTLATASSAALSELSEEDGAIGSAVLQAVNKTGGPLGTAVLGSVLSSGYLAGLRLNGLPVAAASAARTSLFGAAAVADKLHSPALLRSARIAFVHGMDHSLIVSTGIAGAGAVLALLFLPGIARRTAKSASTSGTDAVKTT